MSTLLLRLAAPMQSWGSDSKFERRNTGRTPSKSGVIGLCAAALGYRRDEDKKISRLTQLKFGVRIDKPGLLLKDFHMAHQESFWNPYDRSKINKNARRNAAYLTIRYYLSDAVFLVGLEGDEEYLSEIDSAIRAPFFPLYLGRRSCPPEGHVSCGIVSDTLQAALENYPMLAQTHRYSDIGRKPRLVLDTDMESDSNAHLMRDLPRSFNPEHRIYDFRCVREFDAHMPVFDETHDPLAELEE